MSAMILLRCAEAIPPARAATVAVYGGFDALHRGHLEVLRCLRREADRSASRSLVVAAGAQAVPQLLGWIQRLRFFASSGVDVLLRSPATSSRVDWDLLVRLGVKLLISDEVVEAPAGAGIRVERIATVEHQGERIDDTAVRAAIHAADLSGAAALLGRPYAIDGSVVHGFHRGGPLGIPTANLRVRDRVLPPDGVYAVRARVYGQALGGVANIGVKPTFGDEQRSVETHLFDFSADIYGERLEIDFIRRIRDEKKFSSVDDLLAQIRRDIAAARQILAEP